MKCPKCGSDEQTIVTIAQDEMGNDLEAIVCANGDCDYIYSEQSDTYECLHYNVEVDIIGRGWCMECGDYMGERY